ncbi:AMP-binding protein [Prosthecochloris sp. SCSIO W1101]|uniref:AMP-binding protein n=1 Tax=Prosthecochloris sp. SCSIO W1101 TaxID=2992242 RepID=UPI00223CD85E|nr:AMP-binding protein [Prosthecochloris sp. SCSIO W1101]UZJ41836.1 AMP-binding protein [Prosthecochloris sp. SCSIO W1101]
MLKTDASGWFHTGDTGEMSPDGELLVTGRTDNMFISGGENIHPEKSSVHSVHSKEYAGQSSSRLTIRNTASGLRRLSK